MKRNEMITKLIDCYCSSPEHVTTIIEITMEQMNTVSRINGQGEIDWDWVGLPRSLYEQDPPAYLRMLLIYYFQQLPNNTVIQMFHSNNLN